MSRPVRALRHRAISNDQLAKSAMRQAVAALHPARYAVGLGISIARPITPVLALTLTSSIPVAGNVGDMRSPAKQAYRWRRHVRPLYAKGIARGTCGSELCPFVRRLVHAVTVRQACSTRLVIAEKWIRSARMAAPASVIGPAPRHGRRSPPTMLTPASSAARFAPATPLPLPEAGSRCFSGPAGRCRRFAKRGKLCSRLAPC